MLLRRRNPRTKLKTSLHLSIRSKTNRNRKLLLRVNRRMIKLLLSQTTQQTKKKKRKLKRR